MDLEPDAEISDPNALATISEDGTVPDSRLSSAEAANNLAADLWLGDQGAAFDRGQVDSQIDGFCPMDQGDLRSQGMGNSPNVNFLGSAGKEETACAAYNNLANSSERLITCTIPEASDATADYKAQVFAEEYTYLNRFCWPDFVPNMLYLAKFFIRHGVTIAFRPSSIDWRWQVSRIGNFQVQRRENCSVDDIELAVQRTFYSPDCVWDWIRDAESADFVGWNVPATKEAIKNAVVPLYTGINNSGANWEQWERDAKANSLLWTRGKAKQVELRHFWVKEFDGTVSHYITSPDNDEEFLFEHTNRFKSPTEAFTFFTYGIGNGDLYSIRGLGHKLYGSEQALNVVKNKALSATMRSMSHLWQASDANGGEDFNSIVWGDDTLIPPGFEYKDNNSINLAQNAIPLINMLSSQQSANTGTYTTSPADQSGGDVEKTKAQYLGEAAQQAILSTAAIDLFYQSLDRLHQMTVGALIQDPYPKTMPGGPERWAFIARLMKRGLTMEEIKSVTSIRAVRAVGAGSEAMKSAKLNQLLELAPQLGPVAQRAIQRMVVADLIGIDNVNAIVPAAGEAIPDDKKVAEVETSLFFNGITPEVMPNEIDSVHLAEHFQAMQGIFQRLQQGSIEPQKAIDALGAASQHSHAHIAKMGQGLPANSNGPTVQEIKQANIQLQQLDAQLQKLVQTYQQKQQSDQQAQAQSQQNQSADAMENARKDKLTQAEIARKDAESQATIARENAKTGTALQLSHAKVEQHLQHNVALTNQDLHATAAKTKQDLTARDLKTAQEIEQKHVLTQQDMHHQNLQTEADLKKKSVDTPPNSD